MKCLILGLLFAQSFTAPDTKTATVDVPRIVLQGQGPVGNDATGPMWVWNHAGDGLVIGTGESYRGTGSIIENVKLVKGAGFNGGTALTLKATSPTERAGQTTVRRVLILNQTDLQSGVKAGRWESGLVIDGTALTKSGEAGVRVTHLDGIRIASCTGDFVRLDNAVHVVAHAMQIDPGQNKDGAKVRIRGGQQIFFTAANVFGEVVLEENATTVILDGYFAAVTIGPKCREIVVRGIVGKLTVAAGATGRCDAYVRNTVNESTGFLIK